MYKLSSLFSSRPSWLESFYEILAASTGQGGILMPDTIVMQYHKMSAAFASGRDLSVQKTDLVRGGRVTTKVRTVRASAWQCAAHQLPPLTLQQELFDIARGGTTLGWSGHYVHEAGRSAEGVVSSSVCVSVSLRRPALEARGSSYGCAALIRRDASQVAYHISNPAAYSVDPTGLTPQIEYEPLLTQPSSNSRAFLTPTLQIFQRGVASRVHQLPAERQQRHRAAVRAPDRPQQQHDQVTLALASLAPPHST